MANESVAEPEPDDKLEPIPAGAVWSASKAITEEDGLPFETSNGRVPVTKPVMIHMKFAGADGRRTTRFVAQFFEQAGHPGLALVTAEAVAELLNAPRAAEPFGSSEELRLLRAWEACRRAELREMDDDAQLDEALEQDLGADETDLLERLDRLREGSK